LAYRREKLKADGGYPAIDGYITAKSISIVEIGAFGSTTAALIVARFSPISYA